MKIINYAKAKKLLEKADLYDLTNDKIKEEYENYYLTINKGIDGNIYYWYMDELHNIIMNINTEEIIEDEEEIQKIMNY